MSRCKGEGCEKNITKINEYLKNKVFVTKIVDKRGQISEIGRFRA